jgi:hypothetical protein
VFPRSETRNAAGHFGGLDIFSRSSVDKVLAPKVASVSDRADEGRQEFSADPVDVKSPARRPH